MANQSKLQQQERKAQKKGKQKIQKVQEKIHDIVNGDKNTRKRQKHRISGNCTRITETRKEVKSLTRKFVNLLILRHKDV